jgi:hypothetical protein
MSKRKNTEHKERGQSGSKKPYRVHPLCQTAGCTTPVRFIEGGERGRCIKHGGYPLCQNPGCTTRVRFIEGGERGRCSKHGGYPLCQNPGCTTRVAFKEGGEHGRCIKHGGYPLCQNDGCTTRVAFKEGGDHGRCIKHGGYPLCQNDGCTAPVKFLEGGERGQCAKHGGHPLCQNPGCTTTVRFIEGGERGRCIKHGGYPLCQNDGCTTPVKFIEGGERGRCFKHGGYPKCTDCFLFVVRKKGTQCAYCCPGSVLAKRAKKEEEAVSAVLLAHGIVFQREVHIEYSCISTGYKKSAYLDIVAELPDKRVIFEMDEYQHKRVSYSVKCDLARMTNVMAAVACDNNSRPTLWIRFNPNAFKVDGITKGVPRHERYAALLAAMRLSVFRPTTILYMYYDTQQGEPVITSDIDFAPCMKPLLASMNEVLCESNK